MNSETRDKIRAFNRYYTKILGVLNRQYLGSRFSLPETRIIQAIYHNPDCSAKDIASMLNMDKSYLSRVLKKFDRQKYIVRNISADDHRCEHLTLTEIGIDAFHEIDATANNSVDEMCSGLNENQLSAVSADGTKEIYRYAGYAAQAPTNVMATVTLNF